MKFLERIEENVLAIQSSLLFLQSQMGSSELGDVAQLVEQRTENPCVGGSIPSITTKSKLNRLIINRLSSGFLFGLQFGLQCPAVSRALNQRVSFSGRLSYLNPCAPSPIRFAKLLNLAKSSLTIPEKTFILLTLRYCILIAAP